MWVTRIVESVVSSFQEQFPIVIVTGARQVGKTSLLKHLYPTTSYITLDDPMQLSMAQNTPDEFLSRAQSPVIIDEAQYAPELFRYLKMYVDRLKKPGQYLLTGSQSFPLMQNISDSLAGRAGIVNLPTLSAVEIKGSKESIKLENYIMTGGYPILHSESGVDPKFWYPSYVATYLERDVRNVLNVTNLRDYHRFLRALALRNAQILSLSSIAADVGISPNTVKSWLSVLEGSGIVYLLEPYYRNIGKRLVKSPKVYFTDTGLVLHLLGIDTWNDLVKSPLAGAIWETYVFSQLYKFYLNQGQTFLPLWYWRTKDGEEVDFLIERGSRFIAIESKLIEQPRRRDIKGISDLKKYYGEAALIRGVIICKSKGKYNDEYGTIVDNGLHLTEVLI